MSSSRVLSQQILCMHLQQAYSRPLLTFPWPCWTGFQIFDPIFFSQLYYFVPQQHSTWIVRKMNSCSNSVQVHRRHTFTVPQAEHRRVRLLSDVFRHIAHAHRMAEQTFWISSRISSLLSKMQDWKMWRSISCRMGLIHIAQLCKTIKWTATPEFTIIGNFGKKGQNNWFSFLTTMENLYV